MDENIKNHNMTVPKHFRITLFLLLSLYSIAGFGYPTPKKKNVYVLVHGAWHGGWCWQKMTMLLREQGHEVHTPTLTGLGERSHLLNPNIDLNTHIQDVVSLFEFEDLTDVILVGHSYAGMVITGVAEKIPGRIRQLVYLDAFLPEDGKALRDYVPPSPPPTGEASWRVKAFTDAKGFGVTDPKDIAWVNSRLTDQPGKTMGQPVRVFGVADKIQKSFILLSNSPWFIEASERAQRKGFTLFKLPDAGHDGMITKPKELTGILVKL
jgi:pimeloyl-ACP methyl ester carboxylesterase